MRTLIKGHPAGISLAFCFPVLAGGVMKRFLNFSIVLMVLVRCSPVQDHETELSSVGTPYTTDNFVITAETAEAAAMLPTLAIDAERYRRDLAIAWLGAALPKWKTRVPISITVAPYLEVGGYTSYSPIPGQEPQNWTMVIQGTQELISSAVLKHEIMHTILATHYQQTPPRWFDEGVAMFVEVESERAKFRNILDQAMRLNRAFTFPEMFLMTEYPKDILPLYAEGLSLVEYIQEHSPTLFQKINRPGVNPRLYAVSFIGAAMRDISTRALISDQDRHVAWSKWLKSYYAYPGMTELQTEWIQWYLQRVGHRPEIDFDFPMDDDDLQMVPVNPPQHPQSEWRPAKKTGTYQTVDQSLKWRAVRKTNP